MRIIKETNNSCAGPDGIPFAVYRAHSSVTAELISEVERLMGEGVPPPAHLEYNYARLFLLPKGGTMMALDHRPISVTNADNRILATGITESLKEVVVDLISKRQTGFVPGRRGEDNIIDLFDKYYTAQASGQRAYVILLDIEKAFDSVKHDFIHFMLEKTGMPLWIRNVVRALMTDVVVRPEVGGKVDCDIPINRGVKQGCPLSPFLFLICYEPLLRQLEKEDGLEPYAFADDLAVYTETIEKAVLALNKFRRYTGISGLRVNAKKTLIVSEGYNTEQREKDLARLSFHGWRKIKFSAKGTYLGIIFGKVEVKEIYEKALTEFRRRLTRMKALLRSLSIHRRIILANVFLLSRHHH